MIKKRACPICDSKKYKSLFVQKFASGFNHSIVICINCGFVFVNNTLSQKAYDEYYKVMSKYELERDQILHKNYREIIQNFYPQKSKILDVGSSTGHLLYLLRQSGYTNLLGIDPSPTCREIAWDKFKIKVRTSTISTFKTTKKFDLVILAMILEHLSDIKNSLEKIKSLVSENGYIFISVPDALNFYSQFDEAFGEFSVEHINFFSSKYLFSLMQDYSCIYMESKNNNIFSLWKKTDNLEGSIEKYIELSKNKMKKINKIVNSLPSKALIWGAGSLTQRLFISTNLLTKAVAIIDSDSKLWGKTIKGIKIISPNQIRQFKHPILISSYLFREEILKYIKSKKLINKVVTFK